MAYYSDPFGTTEELLPPYSRLNEPTIAGLTRERMAARDGFQNLGNVIGGSLFGGGARDLRGQQLFNQAAHQSAQVQDILLQARQRRDAEIGRQAAAKAFFDKGDTESGNAVLNAPNSETAALALSHLQRMRAISGTGAALQGIGLTPQLAQLGQTMVGASGGTNTQGDIEAMTRAGMLVPGTAAVPQSTAVLGRAIKPDSTRIEDGYLLDTTDPNATPTAMGTAKALMAERYAQAARANKAAGTDKLQVVQTQNEDGTPGPFNVVDLTTGKARPVTTDAGGNLMPAPKGNAGAGKLTFSPSELITQLGTQTDDKGKYLPNQANILRFNATKAAMKAAGDPNWNNDPLVLAKMREQDTQDAAYAASSGPSADLETPQPGVLSRMFPGNVMTPVDAQGRALSDLGTQMAAPSEATMPAATPAVPAVPAGQVARPKNKAEFDALPKGTTFIASDGSTRVKS